LKKGFKTKHQDTLSSDRWLDKWWLVPQYADY